MKIHWNRLRDLLRMSWPLIVANSFWNLQLTIDRIFLGQFSTEALGAALAVMGVFWVPMALLQQTASYVTTFVAQYTGANDQDRVAASFWQSIWVSVVGGIAFFGLNFLSTPFFAWVGHSPSLQPLEVEYFNSLSSSALPTAVVAAIGGYYTGLGQTQKVMLLNFVGLVLNAVLDPLMILGLGGFPKMGAAGAGYATGIAGYGAAIVGIWMIFKSTDRTRLWAQCRWDPALLKQFLKFGLPSGFQWAFEGLAFTVFLILIGRLPNGEVTLASSSITVTIMMLSVLPCMGIAQAVMTNVGQALGAKNPREAEQSILDGVQISFFYIMAMGFTFWFFPQFYLSWFKNGTSAELWSQVEILAPRFLAIMSIFTIFDSLYLNVSFGLKGAGDTRFVSWIALVLPWPCFVIPTWFLTRGQFTEAATLSWLTLIIYSISITTVLTLRFKRGRWKTMSVMQANAS